MPGLLFINAQQILSENILCKGRTQIVDALLCQIAFVLNSRINNQMHMGMIAFVMKGGKPFQMLHRDFQIL